MTTTANSSVSTNSTAIATILFENVTTTAVILFSEQNATNAGTVTGLSNMASTLLNTFLFAILF